MNRMLPRVGLWALPLAGALIGAPWYLFGGFGGGGVRALDRDPAGFVRAITAPGAAAAGYAYVAGLAPRWAGVLFALGFLLVILSTPIVTPLGALLVLLGGGGMAWSLRGEATATRLEPA